MKKTIFALALASSFGAMAQVDQANTCESGSPGPCTNSNQHQGNTTSEVTGNVQAPVTSTQQGVASTSNASGNDLDASNQSQVTQSPTSHITSTINPNTASSATGNRSDNANNSAATSGPVTGTNTSDNRSAASSTGKVDSTNVLGQQQGIQGSGNSKASGGQGGAGGSSGASAAGGSAQGGSASTGPISNVLGASSGVKESGNSSVQVDASDRSSTQYTSRATVWAPVVHGPAAPALGVGNMAVTVGACGPRVNIVRRSIVGVHHGALGGRSEETQGQDEITAPAAEPFSQHGPYLMGHRVTRYMVVLGTSSASSFSIGGFSNNGGGAQGGSGGSGQIQQMASRVAVDECLVSVEVPMTTPVAVVKPIDTPRADRN